MNFFLLVLLIAVLSCAFAYDYRYEPNICSRDPAMKCITDNIAACSGDAKRHVLALQNWGHMNKLQIHGLWREEDCHCADGAAASDSFELTKLSVNTRAQMDLYWNGEKSDEYTTQGKANCHLWEHEWNCHGICSGLSQEDYFKKALQVYHKYQSCAKCHEDGNCDLIHLDENFKSDCLGNSPASPSTPTNENNNTPSAASRLIGEDPTPSTFIEFYLFWDRFSIYLRRLDARHRLAELPLADLGIAHLAWAWAWSRYFELFRFYPKQC